jgi:phage-related minor tail protein
MPAGKKRRELLAAINGMVSEAVGSMAALANVPVPTFAPSGPDQSYVMSGAEAAAINYNLGNIVPADFNPFAGVSMFAKGGIVTAPTLGMVGEAGPEAIIPLNRAGKIGGTTINLTVNAGMGTQGAEVGRQIVEEIKRYERVAGPVFVSS